MVLVITLKVKEKAGPSPSSKEKEGVRGYPSSQENQTATTSHYNAYKVPTPRILKNRTCRTSLFSEIISTLASKLVQKAYIVKS